MGVIAFPVRVSVNVKLAVPAVDGRELHASVIDVPDVTVVVIVGGGGGY